MLQRAWWEKHGVTMIAGAAILAMVAVVIWLYRPRPTTTQSLAPASARSADGWQVRYNATLALARRGSASTPVGELKEMLDEEQQLRNFTVKTETDHEAPDEQAARTVVLKALDAVVTLHQKQPSLDLADVTVAVKKLTESPNLTLREKARDSLKALGAA